MPPKKKITADAPEGETLTRIAIVNQDRFVVMCMHMSCNFVDVLPAACLNVTIKVRVTCIAAVDTLLCHRCKPKKCRQECKKGCPVVKIGEPVGSFTHRA